MKDSLKTKQELIKELSVLKKKIGKLGKSESQQKLIEMELHKSEHKFRQLAEDMPALICTFLPDSTLTYVNKAYCELFQKRPDDLVGKKFLDFLPDYATRENVVRQYMSLTAENPVKTYEHKVILSDGTDQYHWHRWTDRAFFNDNGQISHFQSIGQEITERKRADDALRENEDRLMRISSIISDVTYSCTSDENGTFSINWMMGAAELVTGYSIDEIKEQGCWGFLVIEEDKSLFEENVIGLAPGSTESCELRIRHKNGGIVWLASCAECVMVSEKFSRSVLYGGIIDITERKLAEVESKLYAKELEDANTALRVVMSRQNNDQKMLENKLQLNTQELVVPYLKKLKDTKLDSRQKDYLSVLESNLNNIVSPYMFNLSAAYKNLTPQEIQIANLIRQGKNTKNIAELLCASAHTVGTHRNNIRKKLKLRNSKSNLRSHLLSLS